LIALLRERLPGLWNSAVETRVRREVGRFVRAPLTLEAQQIAQLLELSACTEGARRKARRELEHLRRATPGSAEVAGLRRHRREPPGHRRPSGPISACSAGTSGAE
jgi:hypothetical protein